MLHTALRRERFIQAETSGSASHWLEAIWAVRVPAIQSAAALGYALGGHSWFLRASSQSIASTNARNAALKVGWHVRTCCNVIRPGSKIGRAGDRRSPAAEQSTYTWPGAVGSDPPSITIL